MIPWDTFKTPQDAYEFAKANLTAFNYNEPITSSTRLFLRPDQTTRGTGFYTDFTGPTFTEVLRLPVRR